MVFTKLTPLLAAAAAAAMLFSLLQGLIEVLGLELGDFLDSTGLLPPDMLGLNPWDPDEDEDEEDEEEEQANKGARGHGGRGGGGSGRGGLLLHPRRIRALRKRYNQLQRIALQVGAGGGFKQEGGGREQGVQARGRSGGGAGGVLGGGG